jgi:hypothetical protein
MRLVTSKKVSASNKKYYANLSDDEKRLHAQRGGSYWNSLSDDEKRQHAQRGGSYWNSLSDEEKQQYSNKRKEYWKSLSNEEKKQKLKHRIDWWNSLSDEEKQKQIQGLTDYWNIITDEERETISRDRSQWMTGYWDNLSDEGKLKISYRSAVVKAESARSKPITNELELKFQQILDDRSIPYKYQYTTVQSPKNWDFAIYDNPEALPIILIDVDGPIHDSDFPINPDKNRGFKTLRELSLYYDNRRTEQTDGIDYFIINYKTFDSDVDELIQKLKK